MDDPLTLLALRGAPFLHGGCILVLVGLLLLRSQAGALLLLGRRGLLLIGLLLLWSLAGALCIALLLPRGGGGVFGSTSCIEEPLQG
jgi:hypothetical protein